MKIEDVKKIAVIGTGLMGSQIAEILSRVGAYEIHMMDINEELVKKGFQKIEEILERFFVSKGKLTAGDKKAVLARIKIYTSVREAVEDADFVIEAASESKSRSL